MESLASISMTPKELLVLAAKLGAGTFFGLRDPFRGMSRADIRAALPQLEQQAERRGLAAMGFDLSFTVEAEAAALISTCAMCERYVTVDAMAAGQRQPKEVLYARGGSSVLLQDAAEEVVLRRTEGAVLCGEISDRYFSGLPEETPASEGAVRVPPALLRELRSAESGGAERLTVCGCSPAMAETVLRGLRGQCTYLSVVRVDLKENACVSLLCVLDEAGAVRLWPENDAGEEICRAAWMGKREAETALAGLFRSL